MHFFTLPRRFSFFLVIFFSQSPGCFHYFIIIFYDYYHYHYHLFLRTPQEVFFILLLLFYICLLFIFPRSPKEVFISLNPKPKTLNPKPFALPRKFSSHVRVSPGSASVAIICRYGYWTHVLPQHHHQGDSMG